MTLSEQSQSIRSREDFVKFVKALRKDLQDNPESWENVSLEDYLEALGAWVEDIDAYYINHGMPVPEQPDWKVLGNILMAAKMYE